MQALNADSIDEKEMGYLIGFFIGDGYLFYSKNDRHYTVEFCFSSLNDVEISKNIKNILYKMGLKFFIINDKRFNSFKVKVNSKLLYIFIKNKLEEFEKRCKFSEPYKLGLLSGFIDADGYVGNGEILLTQKRYNVIMKFVKITKSLGIDVTKIWSKTNFRTTNLVWRARISTKLKNLKHNSYKVRLAYSEVEHNL